MRVPTTHVADVHVHVQTDVVPQPTAITLTLPHWWAAYAHARHCVEQLETMVAERLLRDLCAALPERAEPYALLAHVLRASEQVEEAAALAQYALSLPVPTDGTQHLEPDAWRMQPLEDLAISSWHRKEYETGQWLSLIHI